MTNMSIGKAGEQISCQFSIYPIRQAAVSPALRRVVESLDALRIEYEVGGMSTLMRGSEEQVFSALRAAFAAVTEGGEAVLVATVSNGCPAAVD